MTTAAAPRARIGANDAIAGLRRPTIGSVAIRALVNKAFVAVGILTVVLVGTAAMAGASSRDPFQPIVGATTPTTAGSTTATTAAGSGSGSGSGQGTTSGTTTGTTGGQGGTAGTAGSGSGVTPGTTANPQGATTPGGGSLPMTGSHTRAPLLAGLLAVLFGVPLAYAGRRRWDARRYLRC